MEARITESGRDWICSTEKCDQNFSERNTYTLIRNENITVRAIHINKTTIFSPLTNETRKTFKMTLLSTDNRTSDKKNMKGSICSEKLIFNEPKCSGTLRKLYFKMKPLLASN